MTKKYGVAFWYNLKGWYDVLVFKDKRRLNKFVKDYKELYDKMMNEEITWDDFEGMSEFMFNSWYCEDIIKVIDELRLSKDDAFIIDDELKIYITDYLDYGV